MRPSSLSARLRRNAPKAPPSSENGLRGEPGRQRLAQDAAHQTREGRPCEPQLGVVDPGGGAHVDQPVDVVAVMVGEHDLRDVVKRQAGRRQGCRELLLGRHLETGERNVPGFRSLTAVYEQQAPVVLDRPAVDRHRVRPGAGQEQVQLPPRALAGVKERVLQAHRPGREGVDSHMWATLPRFRARGGFRKSSDRVKRPLPSSSAMSALRDWTARQAQRASSSARGSATSAGASRSALCEGQRTPPTTPPSLRP